MYFLLSTQYKKMRELMLWKHAVEWSVALNASQKLPARQQKINGTISWSAPVFHQHNYGRYLAGVLYAGHPICFYFLANY